jgi:hypothetical protein
MSESVKEVRKVFSLEVKEAGKLYNPVKWELSKNTVRVKGIQLTSDFPNKLYYRGTQRIEIGGDELFPEGFDAKVLLSSISVPPRERFFDLGEVQPGDLSVKVRYQDQNHERAALGKGYTVIVVLLVDETA